MIIIKFLSAEVTIKGIKPLIFNRFDRNSIPLERKEKNGVPGHNPDEWKTSYYATEQKELYIPGSYIHSCLINGARHTKRGLQKNLAATLNVQSEISILNRSLPDFNLITEDPSDDVYIDVRSVVIRTARHIRYRVATKPDWETTFTIAWDASIVSRNIMEKVCIDSGLLEGLGDNRKNGFGRFIVKELKTKEVELYNYA